MSLIWSDFRTTFATHTSDISGVNYAVPGSGAAGAEQVNGSSVSSPSQAKYDNKTHPVRSPRQDKQDKYEVDEC